VTRATLAGRVAERQEYLSGASWIASASGGRRARRLDRAAARSVSGTATVHPSSPRPALTLRLSAGAAGGRDLDFALARTGYHLAVTTLAACLALIAARAGGSSGSTCGVGD